MTTNPTPETTKPAPLQGLAAYLRCEAENGLIRGSEAHTTFLQWASEVDAAALARPQEVADKERAALATAVRDQLHLVFLSGGDEHDAEAFRIQVRSLLAASRAPVAVGVEPSGLRDVVAQVCEGWTLPEGARKMLETALWATPSAGAGGSVGAEPASGQGHGADVVPNDEFAALVVQEACETEPADPEDSECIKILAKDLHCAVLAAFLRRDAATPAPSVPLGGGEEVRAWYWEHEDATGKIIDRGVSLTKVEETLNATWQNNPADRIKTLVTPLSSHPLQAQDAAPVEGALIDWDMESLKPLEGVEAIYDEYAKSFGKQSPDAEMSAIVRKVHYMLFDWWTSHRDAIKSALETAAGAQGDAARLDFMANAERNRLVEEEENGLWRVYEDVAPKEGRYPVFQGMTDRWYPTPREAIDAAIAALPTKEA